jgi:hypothetical protein
MRGKTEANIPDMYGLSPNEIYACGSRLDNQQPRDSTEYFIFRYDGKSWSVRDFHLTTTTAAPGRISRK